MNTGTRARTETLPSLPTPKSPAGRQVLEVLTGPGLPLQELAPAVFLALPSAVATTKTYLQCPYAWPGLATSLIRYLACTQ